ncbi:hypothetical protein AB833_31305 [Chromatiales bacterium (ex Bugula neritina AB1)]|nr:hypothetical protein AB833_31305 [Chromatiales bacterium (ex Bugula neritina AB1)]
MLIKLKHYAARAISSIVALVVFLFMLPLTLGMMLLMFLVGIATVATMRYRLHNSQGPVKWPNGSKPDGTPATSHSHKAPIDGSYTVIDE